MYFPAFLETSGQSHIRINIEGKEYESRPLDEDGTIALTENIEIEILDKRVRMIKNDCPKQICFQQGWISRSGQILCCVPNKVLIEIISSNKSVDGVAY